MKQSEQERIEKEFANLEKKLNLSDDEKQDVLMQINARLDQENKPRTKTSFPFKYYLSIASMAFLLIILIMPVLPLHITDFRLQTKQVEQAFLDFFHEEMQTKYDQEEAPPYFLQHVKEKVVHEDDAIAIFVEHNHIAEQIFIAYFEIEDGNWQWRRTRGAQWDDPNPINWSAMHEPPYIYSGATLDQGLVEVFVGDVKAEIIIVEGEKRFWYAVSPKRDAEVTFIMDNGKEVLVEKFNRFYDLQPLLEQYFQNDEAIAEFTIDHFDYSHTNANGEVIYYLSYSMKPADRENFVLAGGGIEGEDGWFHERGYYVTYTKEGQLHFATSP
jgi:hypothetical protein